MYSDTLHTFTTPHPSLSLQLCSLKTHSHRVSVCYQSDTGIHLVLITFTVSRFWSNHLFTRNSPATQPAQTLFYSFQGLPYWQVFLVKSNICSWWKSLYCEEWILFGRICIGVEDVILLEVLMAHVQTVKWYWSWYLNCGIHN